tara:strand:- start:88 stop:489 length:402 start_codon:yes stop_codon:yes gene_type:complete
MKDHEDIIGKKVEVYRNLHKNCFSVRHKGKVIGYLYDIGFGIPAPKLYLTNATFAVQPAGRNRVLLEGRKNVHAFVRGTVSYLGGLQKKKIIRRCKRKVTYNPYTMETFRYKNGKQILEAQHVIITKGEVLAG